LKDNAIEEKYIGVAQLIDNLSVGGAEQLAVQIANGLAKAGRPAFVYVLRGTGPLADRIDPGVTLRVLDIHRRQINNPFKFIASLIDGHKKLSRQLKADNVAVVQSHLTHLFCLLLQCKLQSKLTLLSDIILTLLPMKSI